TEDSIQYAENLADNRKILDKGRFCLPSPAEPRSTAVVWDGIAENPVGRSKPIATRWRVVAVVTIVAVEVRVLRARWIPSGGRTILGHRKANSGPQQGRR